MKKILFALPCYNESENLEALVQQFIGFNKIYGNIMQTRLLIINDCSKDNTLEIAQRLQTEGHIEVDIIDHDVNKGLTGGLNSAIERFGQLADDENILAFGVMDGDNTHSPYHIFQMVQRLLQGADVVVASRFRATARIVGVTMFRQILSLGLTTIFKCLGNIHGVRDYSCGFRVYSKRIIKKLVSKYGKKIVTEESFASMVELLVKCDIQGAVCCEIPFILRYDMKGGASKMQVFKTILGNLRVVLTRRKYA